MGDFDEVRELVQEVRKLKPTKYDTYSITEAGKEDVESGFGDEGTEGRILNYLYERSSRTLREIAGAIQSHEGSLKHYIDRLVAKRRVIKS